MSDAPQDEEQREPIPLSALQHAVYCLRQAALIHLERVWEENRFTAEGRVMHAVTDKMGERKIKGIRRVTGLALASRKLEVAGVADLVEFVPHGEYETPYPVEFKRGKAKPHHADEVQLCAQAMCLEEMTGQAVPEGALFYWETKRRVIVPFDNELRALTTDTITKLRDIFTSLRTPPPTLHAERCRACSLHELCGPKNIAKPARAWRSRVVMAMLEDTGSSQ